MKKLLLSLTALAALTLLAPTSGFAYDNIMAIVWEQPASADDALVVEKDLVAPGMTDAYVVLINPAGAVAALYGYEFGYELTLADGANAMVSMTTLAGGGPIDVGGAPGNHIVGLGAPLVTSYCTVVTTLTIFWMAGEVSLTLTGANPNSMPDNGLNLPAVLLAGDVMVQTGLASVTYDGDDPVPTVTACINCDADSVVATETRTWDSLKSLYR